MLDEHAQAWAHLPLHELASTGTDNRLFRIGKAHVLRLPKRAEAIPALRKELTWLPHLRDLPLAVPEVAFHGRTTQSLGYDFGILRWHEGQIARQNHLSAPRAAARHLAGFLKALHRLDCAGAPVAGPANNNRGAGLGVLTGKTRNSIDALADEIDPRQAHALWDRACAAPGPKKAVWVHGDLKADNLIAQTGRLTAVIDWGLSAVGDPAVDYAAAWSWVEAEDRATFQDACAASPADWARAEGWALYTAVIALAYYRNRSHPALCEHCRATLSRLGLLRLHRG